MSLGVNMFKKTISFAVLCSFVVTVFLGSGCGKGKVSVTAAGSTAFQPFAEKLAEQFMQSHPDINVTVQGGGSAVGIQSAVSGAADIGMADLVNLPPEASALKSVVVAKDGIAVIVHPQNPVKDLSIEQIRNIFNGVIKNWSEVGGEERPITVVSREAGSGTRSSFEAIVGGVELVREAIIQDSNGTVRETVANDVNAIGYLSHGLVNEKVKAVTVSGVECTPETITNGQYTLVRPVFFLTKGEPQGAVKAFIDFVLSSEGQKTIVDSGLLPAK